MTSPPRHADEFPADQDDSAMRAAVRVSPLPVLLLRVSDRRILEVSDSLASIFGADRDEMLRHDVSYFIDDPAAARSPLVLMATGDIDGYRRVHRSLRRLDGTALTADIWLSAYTRPPRLFAIAIMLPADATMLQPAPEHVVELDDPLLAVGTVDDEWRIDRISSDIEHLLGYPAESTLGASIVPVVHPADLAGLQIAVGEAASGTGGVSIRLRLRSSDDGWRLCRAIVSPSSGQAAPAFGFALAPMAGVGAATQGAAMQLEDQLRLIAREVEAAAVTASLVRMPTALELPILAELSSRELEIVARLLRGDRVPLIARSLFLSESTVRNHLTSVYRKLGVASQQELLLALRVPSAGSGESGVSAY